MWLERSYGDEDDAGSSGKGKGKDDGPREKTPEPTIAAELLVGLFCFSRVSNNNNLIFRQDLVGLIFSATLMQAALSEMNYDANKASSPLERHSH